MYLDTCVESLALRIAMGVVCLIAMCAVPLFTNNVCTIYYNVTMMCHISGKLPNFYLKPFGQNTLHNARATTQGVMHSCL